MSERCRETELQVGAYAAGELDAGAAARIRRHLAECPACRGELAAERELRRSFADLDRPRCPDAVTARIRALTVAPSSVSSRRPQVYRWGLGLAAAAVLTLLLWPAGRGPQPPTPGPGAWSEAEVLNARRDAVLALAWTAEILERTERHAVQEVFGRTLAGSVQGSLQLNAPAPQGGEG